MRARKTLTLTLALTAAALAVAACGWDPKRPFERESPEVREAVAVLDAGDAQAAASGLEEYLSTGACAEGSIGTPERVRSRPNGAFDLGLALFKIGEAFGRRFGDEEIDAGAGGEELQKLRRANVDCALRIVRAMADSEGNAADLRSRAHYLEGNLEFLDGQYEDAVKAYDKSIGLTPGMVDAGDPVGRDAAWNRAIALRRIDDKKDAGNDASQDGASDSSDKSDASKDGGGGDSGKSPDGGDGDKDGGGQNGPDGGGGNDASSPQKPDGGNSQNEQDAAPPPPPRANQDDRILDQLESAPTLQQEAAKNAAGRRRVRGMADK